MAHNEINKDLESSVGAFMKLGFPRYESLILTTLTLKGTSNVKELQEITDIPLPKIYQTLDSLLRKNFIKEHSKTRPVQFTSYAPDIIIRRIQEENRTAEEKLMTELKHLSEIAKPSFASEISPFTGIDAFKRIAKSVILNAEKQLSIATSINTISMFENELRILKNRGVELRSILFSQLSLLNSTLKPDNYKALGFEHYLIKLPIAPKPSLNFITLARKISSLIDYLGVIISDNGESVVLLPLFPNQIYFGIWIYSKEIINRQLIAYNELRKIADKA